MATINILPIGDLDVEIDDDLDARAVSFVANNYPSEARGPMHRSRKRELETMQAYAKHYNIEITEDSFDWGIALRFADGCEFEWRED